MDIDISHLVLAGGGSIGFKYIGILKHLCDNNVIHKNKIKSIYATSVGTLIATFVCLGHSWEDIDTYVVNRPWEHVFQVSGRTLMDVYEHKGVFDKTIIEIILKPLLESVNLSADVSLSQLYAFSNICIHLFTFNLNTHTTIDMSHITHPDTMLIDAIFMSMSFPILCKPVIVGDGCFIDGGVMCNYPLHVCVNDYPDEIDNILGLTYTIDSTNSILGVDHSSDVFDFALALMNIPTEHNIIPKIKHEIVCCCDKSPMNLHTLAMLVSELGVRRKWIGVGEEDARKWIIQMEDLRMAINIKCD